MFSRTRWLGRAVIALGTTRSTLVSHADKSSWNSARAARRRYVFDLVALDGAGPAGVDADEARIPTKTQAPKSSRCRSRSGSRKSGTLPSPVICRLLFPTTQRSVFCLVTRARRNKIRHLIESRNRIQVPPRAPSRPELVLRPSQLELFVSFSVR